MELLSGLPPFSLSLCLSPSVSFTQTLSRTQTHNYTRALRAKAARWAAMKTYKQTRRGERGHGEEETRNVHSNTHTRDIIKERLGGDAAAADLH